ncbi:MAG: integrase [Alphaproteobacteria bacterium]|nr:MAG: integrase [Alphaproteobacteria bacterium]
MPQLCFTDLDALDSVVTLDGVTSKLSVETIALARSFGLVDGMPFILSDDGSYDHDINRFFRTCPTMGVRSLNSLRAYGRDIIIWLRFLAERRGGKSLWSVDREDIAAFYEARRFSDPPHRISASSWNRSTAVLDKLYRWAMDEKLIAKLPFTYKRVWTPSRGGAAVTISSNCAYEPAARRGDVRIISLEHYLKFRDIGLRGRLPDGREDPTWCGRNGERNALFAELLVTTGLRLQEASSLLVMELPDQQQYSKQRSVAVRLAAETAKGGNARDYRLPLRLLKRLHEYIELQRANSVARYNIRRCTNQIKRPIIATDLSRQSLQVDSTEFSSRVHLDRIKPKERARLVHSFNMEPLALWLTEGGMPMSMAAWQVIFRRASSRCQRFGIDIDVSPHVLRHVFATNMLALLLREQIGWMLEERTGRMSPAYRRMIGDPLLKLQILMGHRSIKSTYIYLDYLDDSQALIDAAVDQWGFDVAAMRDTV